MPTGQGGAGPMATAGVTPPMAAVAPPPAETLARFANAVPSGWVDTAAQPFATISLAQDTASYVYARRVIAEGRLPGPAAIRPEEFLNAFDYGYPLPAPGQVFGRFVAVYPSPWAPGRQIVQIGLRSPDAPSRRERPKLNLVFLIDVSGSMQGKDRLELLRDGLRLMLPQLTAADRVSLVTYANDTRTVLDSVPGDRREEIQRALDGLRAGGGTAGGAGLRAAYALAERQREPEAVNRVILATDGDFNLGASSPAELERLITEQRRAGLYLTAIGVGMENLNDRTLHTLARAGNGTAIHAATLEDLRRGLVEDLSGNILPAADDVKLQVEFNPARVSYYRLIGFETRQLRREDLRNDRADAGEVGTGRSITALFEIAEAGSRAEPVPSRRYGPGAAAAAATRAAGGLDAELGFLRVTYKRPGQARAEEIDRPITLADRVEQLEAAPEAARLAAAIAGFAERLRRSEQIGRWSFADSLALAEGARGADRDGRRAELIATLRMAVALEAAGR
ncbi:von Willebrand factor type A domain-containing protein [Pseudoroseomonas cervicalis]|uniref:vWA domain-containing protein n=1 Tax=Teichococcus cervicalis TaxID=204525 RepID=UPI0022F15A19|nr:von Willebrand factor type A domain-containing protein [Pseudoroseomonas cervicalis]WBV43009.1 von Willebrand factor type A domain-containing protein [Pseudoroseomonas cervicalis]